MGGIGAIESTIDVQAYDENGVAKTTGGDFFFLHVEQLCFLSPGNYRCDLSLDQTNTKGLPILKLMTDNGDGTYSIKFTIYENGSISVSIVLARIGGLYAEYFNNAFLDGPNVLSRVDNTIDFDWSENLITAEAGDFVSAHWYGKLRAPITEEFTFIFNADDGFRFYFDTELLVDRWDTCCDEMMIRLNLVKD